MKILISILLLLSFTKQSQTQPVWNTQNSGTSNNLNRIITGYSNNGQMLFVAGDNGTILRSSNFGLMWEMVNSNTNSNLYSLEISGNDTGYAVGSGGTIIRTIDGGNTWTGMISNTANTLKEIRIMYGNTKAIAVGENGTFLTLANNVWTATQIDTTDLNSISFEFVTPNRMIAVGNYGTVLRSTNSGVNWNRLNSNTANNLNYVLGNNLVYVVGNNGTALQINGTLINSIITGTFSNLYHFTYTNGFVNLVCGANGTVLQNWSPLFTNSNQKLNSIIQTSDDICFVTGDNGLILFTSSINETANSKLLNSNNISTWYRNNGSFNRNPATGNSGFEWPKNSAKFARYASGLWLGAKVGNDTLVAIAEYDYEYLPGYVDNNGNPQGNGDPLYRVYSIIRGDTTSPDYLSWPANQGAYLNSQGNPFFLGTQTMFYSYTDGYPGSHSNNAGSTAPLKAVILQTNWSYINVNMQDITFTEYKIINRNNQPWTNAYISIWTDDDLGNATDDAVGIDTTLNLGYTYNFNNSDPIYGIPPAVGFLQLRSPIVPSPGDTVRYYNPPGSNNLIVKPNYRELDLTSFNLYTGADPSTGDPQNFRESYFNMQGLKRTGAPWINPFNSQPSNFPYSGDPVTSTGWLQTSGGDRRSLMSFGPLNMNPGDTQSVIIAQVIARGSSNLNSITQLRSLSTFVQTIYDQNFQSVLSVNNISTEIPDRYLLNQNYPNPFNPNTIINYELGITNYVTLKVYDALGKEVATLVNEKQNAGRYSVTFNGSNLSSGIYFYKIEINDFIATKKMLLVK